MNDSTIVITGMILLMAPIAYEHPSKNTKIHAAVAVNAMSPESSTYGVDIPEHFAALLLPARKDLKTNAGGRLVDVDGGKSTKLELYGDLVQLGTFSSDTCTPITDDPYNFDQPTITNSIKALPRMADLVEDVGKRKLYEDSHPTYDGKYDGVNKYKDRVAAWMEIPLGRLSAIHSHPPQVDEAMFLPLHRNALMASGVTWHVLDKADCVLVTPFKDAASAVYVAFNSKKVSMTYQNVAAEHSGETMAGVGFDFELLYSLFEVKPTMPPIPFSVGLMNQGHPPMDPAPAPNVQGHGRSRRSSPAGAKANAKEVDIENANTGVNCGPATIPSGG
ncbi:MAG: hypothetical protein QOC81_2008 [Thermoanaerobaculia bacterium]|jgi:hypothetical protein|nr:hypothetical protein [Thermoanaerobaculia bacterium]